MAALTAMDQALTDQTAAATAARIAFIAATFAEPKNDTDLRMKAGALTTAELALANARADQFTKLQAGAEKLNAEQVTALVAMGGRAGGGRGGGVGGRGSNLDPGEIVAPLGDFGGGSGVGAMWLHEPGIPAKWNDAPYTADYGQRASFLHRLTPKGATFETIAPNTSGNEPFIQTAIPMDGDVDANSNIYLVSWRGGGFGWGSVASCIKSLTCIRHGYSLKT